MRNFYTLLLACLTAVGFAQTLPLDFETSYTWTGFDGGDVTTIANPHNDAGNSSANVGQMVKSAGQVWGGAFLTLEGPIDFTGYNALTVKVYAPHANTKVLLKVENSTNTGLNFENTTTMGTTGAWEDVTIDFSALNTSNTYDRVVIIFDNGTMGDGSANFTYLFDDIALGNTSGSGLEQMDLPVTFEDATVDYGLIPFGGSSTAAIVANPDTNINTSATVGTMTKTADAPTWAGTTFTAASNLGFSTPLPFTSTDTKMNVMFWSPDAGIQVRLKAEDHTNGTHSVETEATTTVANQWEVLEFDFSNQSSGTAALDLSYVYDKVSIFPNYGVEGSTAGEKTYYFDDLKFGPVENAGVEDIDGNGSKISFYPNPARNGAQITFSDNVKSVEFYDLNGKKVQSAQGNEVNVAVPAGIYLLQVTDNEGNMHNEKLIVR